MSEQQALLAALILWPLMGLARATVLRRRGHEPARDLATGSVVPVLVVPRSTERTNNDDHE